MWQTPKQVQLCFVGSFKDQHFQEEKKQSLLAHLCDQRHLYTIVLLLYFWLTAIWLVLSMLFFKFIMLGLPTFLICKFMYSSNVESFVPLIIFLYFSIPIFLLSFRPLTNIRLTWVLNALGLFFYSFHYFSLSSSIKIISIGLPSH